MYPSTSHDETLSSHSWREKLKPVSQQGSQATPNYYLTQVTQWWTIFLYTLKLSRAHFLEVLFMTELLFNEQKLPLLFETSETKEQCTMVKAWMSVATWPAVHFEQHRWTLQCSDSAPLIPCITQKECRWICVQFVGPSVYWLFEEIHWFKKFPTHNNTMMMKIQTNFLKISSHEGLFVSSSWLFANEADHIDFNKTIRWFKKREVKASRHTWGHGEGWQGPLSFWPPPLCPQLPLQVS